MTTTPLFVWQRAVIAATSLPEPVRFTGLRVSLDSSGATGSSVVINVDAVASDVGCSARTVWRRLEALVDAGWLTQTARPTWLKHEGTGRRAQYRLLIPVDSCAKAPPGVSHECSDSCDTDTLSDGTRVPDSCAKPPPDVARIPPVTTTTAAAAARETSPEPDPTVPCGPVPIEILASKLRRHTPLAGIRTDKLKPDQTTRLLEVINRHGDTRLVDRAVLICRPHDPPQTIQAFLPDWEAMPAPGERLALVPERPCPEPGHSGTVRRCNQCSADALAGNQP